MINRIASQIILAAFCAAVMGETHADDSATRGYKILTEVPLLTSDFSQLVFDDVWKSWPQPLRSEAEKASPRQRRKMAFDRYGLTTRPGDDSGNPLQYVVDAEDNWTMNCFSCHGGSVYGVPTPGAPNNRFALQTLTEEIRATKFRLGKPLSRMDVGALVIPLGTTHGTTNAVVFGMGLMSYRDEQLNLIDSPPRLLVHHDMDAPPWWHFHKRPSIYIDGFAAKGHRALMQFMLIPENGPGFFREHEDEFRDVFAYLSSLRPPKYPEPIDAATAERGSVAFQEHCSECHGTYGPDASYPNRRIPIQQIGTDPVRLTALSVDGRRKYSNSWFAEDKSAGQQETVVDPDGYVAPPLDGVWASPPYLHNGSVPTLWHLLNPQSRPEVWRRVGQAMDRKKVGFQIEVAEKVPLTEPDVAIRRSYFDTRRFGKSRAGHEYPNQLTETEKLEVLEYLKTL